MLSESLVTPLCLVHHFTPAQGATSYVSRYIVTGTEKEKNTRISVFIYLMRGENDNPLTWPFTGKVSIVLLNQLNDKFHNDMHIEFEEFAGNRVLDGDRAKSGHGCQKFIAHSSLDHHNLLNRQFLKDDCLYFGIKVNCASSPKPWLSSTNEF